MSVELVTFQVLGKPEPQGSATAFVPLKGGQPIRRPGGSIVVNVTSDNPELKKWRKKIAEAAREACGEAWVPIIAESLEVEAHFFLYRSQDQWGTGRNARLLKDSQPAAPMIRPDVDKLLRAVLDGLCEVVYADDAVVTSTIAEKHYAVPTEFGDGEGVRITVRRRARQTASELLPEERVRFVAPEPLEADDSQLAIA